MALKKVTSANYLPGEGDDRFPVYSKQLNEALKALNGEASPQPVSMKKPTMAISTDTTLSARDSGKTIFLDGAATLIVTLPPAESGLTFTFVLIDATANVTVVQNAATEDFVGTVINGAGTSDSATGSDNEILFSGTGTAAVGDWASITCYTDDDWYVQGGCKSAAGVTFRPTP